MKAIIGTEDDVIGFGLTGIDQRLVIPMDADLPTITDALSQLDDETQTVLINESLLTKLEYHDKTDDYNHTFIMIPDTDKTPNIDEIESLAKETLGIDI